MSFITTDYSKLEKSGYDALPTGEYEMVIRQVMEKAMPSGSESLEIDLIVRNDVKQVQELSETNGKYANRHVFMDNWKRRGTKQYDLEGFMYILEAAGVPEGTPINSVDDFIDLLTGKPVRVYVKKEVDDYKTTDPNNPEYRNNVAPWNISATKFKEVNHQYATGADQRPPVQQSQQVQQQNQQAEHFQISDDDMPF